MSSGGSNPLFATVGEARNNMRDLRTIHEEVRESYDPSRESHTRERPLLRSTGNATGSIGGPHHAPLIHTSRGSRGSREESREYSLFDVAAPSASRVIFDHNQSTFRLVNTGEFIFHFTDGNIFTYIIVHITCMTEIWLRID